MEALDLAERIRDRLGSAESEGIIQAVEVKGTSGSRPRATAPEAKSADSPSLDLSLLADVFWDDVSERRGWSAAGVPVEPTLKQRWGEALADILDQLLESLSDEQRGQVVTGLTFVGTTAIIAYPRERVVRKLKKAAEIKD